MRIEIKINGTLLDLPDELSSFSLTYGLKDRAGITTNTGTRSEYSFVFPATKQNNAVFSRFFDAKEVNPSKQLFLPAEIKVNGLPYFQGKAQLTSATAAGDLYERKGKGYKVAFYGNNVDWVADLREKNLSQYDYGTHTFDDTTIQASFANSYPTAYKYQPIKLKDWRNSTYIEFTECTPMLNFGVILDKIFDDLGYTINSTFLTSDFFRRLYLPVLLPAKFDGGYNEQYLQIAAEETGFSFSASPTPVQYAPFIFTTQTLSPTVGANPYSTVTGSYIAPYDGFYLVKFSSTFYNISGVTTSLTFGVTIQQNGGNLTSFVANQADPLNFEYVVNAAAGDNIRLVITVATVAGLCTFDGDLFLEISGELTAATGLPINFQNLVDRNYNSLDFIKGISHAFNLVWQTNTLTRQITVEPADSYQYQQITAPPVTQLNGGFYENDFIDYTRKIDTEKTAELKSKTDEGEKLAFTWKSEGETEEALNSGLNLPVLGGRYAFPAGRYSKAAETIENPFFAATLCYFDNEIRADSSINSPQLPIIWNGNYLESPTSSEQVTSILPRILYVEPYIGLSYKSEIRISLTGAALPQDLLAPLAYMMHYNDNSGGNFISLNFGNQTVNGNEIKGLLDRFYLNALKRLQIGKELEEYIFFNLLDIQGLDFRKKREIKGAGFILQEVNNFDVLSSQSSKTYLVYDAPLAPADSKRIESSEQINKI